MGIKKLRSGVLDEIARDIGVKSDSDLAKFLGITRSDLESIRYEGQITALQAADILVRREAHLKAAELLTPS